MACRTRSASRAASAALTAHVARTLDCSLLAQLREDPEAALHAPNKRPREVRSGHYVKVAPSKLPQPKLIAHSAVLAAELGFTEEMVDSDAFVGLFSGDIAAADIDDAWCTPYALTIYGEEIELSNAYGDGRAASVGELVVDERRWELQLKGSGTTPFSRSGDGRAVLRSSVCEYLASHAMHALGVKTTRPLALVVDCEETAVRQWYPQDADALAPRGALRSERAPGEAPPDALAARGALGHRSPTPLAPDDPRLMTFGALTSFLASRGMRMREAPPDPDAAVPIDVRSHLVDALNAQSRDAHDSVVVETPVAIATRVAPSFIRIGQIELFARRARAAREPVAGELFERVGESVGERVGEAIGELFELVEHAIFREYGAEVVTALPGGVDALNEAALAARLSSDAACAARYGELLDAASQRLATTTAEWVRVGFVQGNFNSDNCLVGGHTMDYGPFGFVERMEKEQNFWGPAKGRGHFGFLNQPEACAKNFDALVRAVATLVGKDGDASFAAAHGAAHRVRVARALTAMWRRKLGFGGSASAADEATTAAMAGATRVAQSEAHRQPPTDAAVDALVDELLPLMERRADWTIFWRQLAAALQLHSPHGEDCWGDANDEGKHGLTGASLASVLAPAMYPAPMVGKGDGGVPPIGAWVERWRALHAEHATGTVEERVAQMNSANPKYVPRQWMLVDAYVRAQQGDYALVHALQALFEAPYDEQPHFEARFYRRAPSAMYSDIAARGAAGDDGARLYREVMPS